MRFGLVVCVSLLVSCPHDLLAQVTRPRPLIGAIRLTNAAAIRKTLAISPTYDNVARLGTVKVAVLDYGFDTGGSPPGDLPSTTEVVEHYDPEFVRKFDLGDPAFQKGFEAGNRHGRSMARVIWGVSGYLPEGPKFYLLNANGPTMLRRAVRYAIEKKVEIILFSNSFEGGGSGDGHGPINRIVHDAIAADIIWINASGNYGRRVYNSPVRVLNDGFLKLRETGDIAALRFRNWVDGNNVTITLTWNDYREEEDAGTERDLDLYLEDGAGRRIGSGEKVQVGGGAIPSVSQTLNPRERVVLANLPASQEVATDPEYGYKIRVKVKKGLFTARDRIKILVNPTRDYYLPPNTKTELQAFTFLDASLEGELYPPADNPAVLTVGDSDPASSIGGLGDTRMKPETVVNDSRAIFSDGETAFGSSYAAAFVAGSVVVLKAAAPVLRSTDVARFAALGPIVPASDLKGRPTKVTATMRFHLWQMPDKARMVEVIRTGK